MISCFNSLVLVKRFIVYLLRMLIVILSVVILCLAFRASNNEEIEVEALALEPFANMQLESIIQSISQATIISQPTSQNALQIVQTTQLIPAAQHKVIDQELANYNFKMMCRHFILIYKAFDDRCHFNDDEKEVIFAALGNGEGLPKNMECEYLLATGGDPVRMVVINYMIDMSRERKACWKRDNIVAPLSSLLKNMYNKMQVFIGKRKVIGTFRKEIQENIVKSAYPDVFYWNTNEREQFEKCRESNTLREARSIVNKLCVARLVMEANPYEQFLNEFRIQVALQDACSYKSTTRYWWQSAQRENRVVILSYLLVVSICIILCWILTRIGTRPDCALRVHRYKSLKE